MGLQKGVDSSGSAKKVSINDDGSQNIKVVEGSATGIVAITPDDDTDVVGTLRGLYVGVSGNVSVVMQDDTTGVLSSLAAGMVHPLSVKRVLATGTTATNIVGVY